VYSNFTIGSCEWNRVGTFLSGFDFTSSRDANIEVMNCVGEENKGPHAKINLVGNATATTLDANVWTKDVFVNTSSYSCKWGIANNRKTYLSDHTHDIIMFISGNMYIPFHQMVLEKFNMQLLKME